ncbi:MAG: hypothetical protein IPO17_07535 [Flavobacteriales bacterium]|nr:hypothetical protein [Flavobacteriales bacterium]
MATVKLGIDGLPATGLVAYSQHIHDKMEGSVTFATPVPPQVAFQAGISALASANSAAENGGKAEIQARRIAERALRAMMRARCGYVQAASNGDEDLILLTGFGVRKRPAPIGPLVRPSKLFARFTDVTGRIDLGWPAIHGADSYQVFMSTTNNPYNWVAVGNTTKARFEMDGLAKGTTVWMAVAAVGAAGTTSMSEPFEGMAAA